LQYGTYRCYLGPYHLPKGSNTHISNNYNSKNYRIYVPEKINTMTSSENVYDFEEQGRQPNGTKYYFVSEGNRLIAKVIDYSFIGIREGRFIYNLGFGTYNQNDNTIIDDDISANGDTYKVFNTVLSTIPHFLNNYSGALSNLEFYDQVKFLWDIKFSIYFIICKRSGRSFNGRAAIANYVGSVTNYEAF